MVTRSCEACGALLLIIFFNSSVKTAGAWGTWWWCRVAVMVDFRFPNSKVWHLVPLVVVQGGGDGRFQISKF